MKIKKLIILITPLWIINILGNLKLTLLPDSGLKKWEKKGRPLPPPHRFKQLVIDDYQNAFKANILIETGTYKGDMVYAMKDKFQQIYSIELGFDLWKYCTKRFKKYKHIHIIQGDSGMVLVDLIPKIKERAIFWLDGHYSAGITSKGDKDCPIFEELSSILGSEINHIILIDDAHCFDGTGDYPTIGQLSQYVLSKKILSKINVENGIIRIILE
jgi:hypothetical protein